MSSTSEPIPLRKLNPETGLLVVGIFGLVISSIPLLSDRVFYKLLSVDSRKELKEVGKISRFAKDVRRKTEGEVIWLPIQGPEPIFQGDSIFTSDNSEALIQFAGGAEITQSPNSLVVIQQQNQTPDIEVKTGTIRGKIDPKKGSGKGQAFRIRAAGQSAPIEIAANNAEAVQLNFESTQSGKPTLSILSGAANISANGQTQTLKEQQSTSLKADGKIEEVHTALIRLTEPKQEQTFWASNSISVEFKWQGNTNPTSLIEIAKDAKFGHVIRSLKSEKNGVSMAFADQEEGTYYWRVKSLDKSGESPTQSFILLQNPVPSPLLPKSGETLTGSSVLKWNDKMGSDGYQIEISNSPDFKKTAWSSTVNTDLIQLPQLTSGRYFWRIRTVASASRPQSSWSIISDFTLMDEKKVVVEEKKVSQPIVVTPSPVALPELQTPKKIVPLPPPKLIKKNIILEIGDEKGDNAED